MKTLTCSLIAFSTAITVAYGGVFDDAAYWFNANSPNTSGRFATGDLPDYRYAGDPTHPLNQAKPEGAGSCVKFRTESVVYPFACITNVERCLYLEKAYSGSDSSLAVSAGVVQLPALFNVTNAAEFTVVTRFRWDAIREDVSSNNVSRAELFDLAIGSKCGYYLGINRSDGRLWMRDGSHGNTFYLGSTAATYGIKTNVWTDIAVIHQKDANGRWIFQLHLFDEVKNMGSGQWRSASVYNKDAVLAITTSTNQFFRIGAVDGVANGPRSVNTSTANTTGARAFSGSISQFAIWSRALSKDEVAEAFCGKTMQFEYGVENGLSSEFAGTSDTVTANITNSWYHLPAALTAESPNLNIKVTIAPHEAGLPQILRFVPLADSGYGCLSATVNGQPLQTLVTDGGAPLLFYIWSGMLSAGANVISFSWQGSGNLGIDAISCGGSWQIGYADNSNGEFTETFKRYQREYYHNSIMPAASWKTRSNGYVTINTDYTNNNVHFTVPATYTNNRYRVEIPADCGWSSDKLGADFGVYLNGVKQLTAHLSSTDWQTLGINLPRGGLRAGGNTLMVINERKPAGVANEGATLRYDCFRLIAQKPPTGLGHIILVK